MANFKKRKFSGFEFKPFSKKQLRLLSWWSDDSPVSDKFMCIADGSVRSGKTIACLLSFMLYTMSKFEQQNFAIAGKSVGAVRRNLVIPLKSMLISLGYECVEHRSENYLEIIYKDNTNYYYLFGLKDETAADHIQGFTLASAFVDEVAVANENGFNQLLARLSIEGAKVWTSSNPESPYHWFYTNFIKRAKEKGLLYIHFTMDDNPSLSEEIKNRYKKMYSGVWKKRFIDG